MEIIDQYREDILAYGYFTTENHETAQLIANSTFNYHKNPPTMCVLYDILGLNFFTLKITIIPDTISSY